MPSLQAAAAAAVDEAAASSGKGGGATTPTTLLALLQDTSPEKRGTVAEEKMEWLRSQLIGEDVEFDTPFGRRLLTYADQTASGRSLRYVEDYLVSEVLPFYGNTHTEDSHVGKKTTRLMHRAARYVKRCMGGGAGDALLFCGAGTTAAIKRLQEVMSLAAPCWETRGRLAAQLRRDERWVVFVGPYEHHSNLLSWRRSLADVVEIGLDEDGLVDVAALRRALGDPEYADQPLLGSFSACSNVTGIVVDTREIARVLHEHGAFACFDFAASGPYVKIDVKSGEIDGYDAVFLSPHKFIGGPGTPGILLMNKALYRLRSQPPSTCGGGTVNYVKGLSEEDTLYYDDIEEREDAGTPAIVQKIRASLAFWIKEYIGHDTMALQEHVYTEMAMKRLVNILNVKVLGNTSTNRLPIFSFLVYPPVPDSVSDVDDRLAIVRRKRLYNNSDHISNRLPLHGRLVTKLLNDLFGIQARGGCACAGPYGNIFLDINHDLTLRIRSAIHEGYLGLKPGWTRLSFAYYLSQEEFKFILDAIEFIAAYGHRFLVFYKFDWRSSNWTFSKQAAAKELSAATDVLLAEDIQFKDDDELDNDKLETNQTKFETYLENAKKIALSLPSINQQIIKIPEEIDPDIIIFHV
ncbi:probable cysteine desulfurase [Oryza brachyantha]|uniref:probable cysteine desulfurase n=1 Tax=Oryza brachyantha TaxID=4533 RepID=UPI0007765382|nr:probable cysteine desulfurase [Oryza brachyantha]